MTCEECGKDRATVRYTEVVGGELTSSYLCEECARKRGVTGSLASLAGPLVDILVGLLGSGAEDDGKAEGPTCPHCGLSYGEFRRAGRLGCGACYASFRDELKPLLRRVHGSTHHAGRVPSSLAGVMESKREIDELKAELSEAVRREDYERAARLRDLLKAKETGQATPE